MRDYSRLPRVVFKMFDWEGAADGCGAMAFDRWERLNPAQNEYNFGVIDAWLDKQAGKPCVFSVATALSSMEGWPAFYDATPEWVYAGDPNRPVMNGRRVGKIATNADGVQAALPYYNGNSYWWQALEQFTRAFGARYDKDKRLVAVFFGPGLDMENQPSKSPFGDGNQGYRFGQLCNEYARWNAEAFPTKPLFGVCTIGQGRLELAKVCAGLGLGVKHNGLLPDMDSWQGYDNFVGSWDFMQWAMENDVPRWVESAHWLNDENMYWSIPAALHYHPVGVDLHSGWIEAMPADWVAFLSKHVGVTAETSPSAFTVLRDSEYDKREWTQGGAPAGCSGHVGDWQFYLRRTSDDADAPRVEEVGPADAPESRQCRRVTRAEFTVDEGFAPPPYRLSIRFLDEPGHWLSVDNGATMLAGLGSGVWDTMDIEIDARRFTLTGDETAVHRLTVEPIPGEPEPPEPPIELPPPVDWAPMLAEVDAVQNKLDNMAVSLDNLREALATAKAALASAEELRDAAYADLAALRGMMQRARAE